MVQLTEVYYKGAKFLSTETSAWFENELLQNM